MISDLMGLLLLLTSLAFFHLRFSLTHPNMLILSVFLKLPMGPIIRKKKGN